MADVDPIISEAIAHVLRRAGTDPDFHYHMAATESLERLCKARAAITGEDWEALNRTITRGEHVRGTAREAIYKAQVQEVELAIDNHYGATELPIADVRAALEKGRADAG